MADSRLTVRTLGLAMVALVLACVHAARGDGRAGGIATFSSGSRVGTAVASKASSGRGGSITTIRGDPWKATQDRHATAGRSSARPGAQVWGKPRPKLRPASHEPPICIVRRPGETAPIVPLPPRLPEPTVAVPEAVRLKVVPSGRNAFALTASMAAGVR